MTKALITGINGFVGSHLAEFLLKKEYDVYGLVRTRPGLTNINHILDKITLISGDLTDTPSIKKAIKMVMPDEIYHLAAQSYVPVSWTLPIETYNSNVLGQVNLLEAVKEISPESKIQIAGSSEEYGLVHEKEVPIKESNPLRPQSPYGVSKVAQDLMAQQYVASYGMKIFISRAFNHEGPRRGEMFVTSNFAKQVAEIEKGKRQYINHGNLQAIRDFTDVRDMVRAYWLGLNSPNIKWGEAYNICNGEGYRISEIIAILTNNSRSFIKLQLDISRMRPSDVPRLVGDCSKFKEATGWQPTISFKKTMADLLNYWRELV